MGSLTWMRQSKPPPTVNLDTGIYLRTNHIRAFFIRAYLFSSHIHSLSPSTAFTRSQLPTGRWRYQPRPLTVPQNLSSWSPRCSSYLTSFPQQALHLLPSGLTSSFGNHSFLGTPFLESPARTEEYSRWTAKSFSLGHLPSHTCTPSYLLPVGIHCVKCFFPIRVSVGENQTLSQSQKSCPDICELSGSETFCPNSTGRKGDFNIFGDLCLSETTPRGGKVIFLLAWIFVLLLYDRNMIFLIKILCTMLFEHRVNPSYKEDLLLFLLICLV